MANVLLAYVYPGEPGLVYHDFMDSVLKEIGRSTHQVDRLALKQGANISSGRNRIAYEFLKNTKASHLWFVDTDIIFPTGTCAKLLSYDLPIVGARYYSQHNDALERTPFLVGNLIVDGEFRKLTEHGEEALDPDKPTRVDGLGMGCTMIHRDVLQTLGVRPLWPFAETVWHTPEGKEDQVAGEDVTFCLRAADKGFASYMAPFRVGHIKSRILG